MQNMFLLIVGLLVAVIHILMIGKKAKKKRVFELLLLYTLVFGVGIVGLMAFIGHVFFADIIATKIGWATGSMFQFEVGLHDGAWGILGILCIWFRRYFWLATGLGWSLFLIGAGYGHLREMVVNNNYAPYNYGYMAPDFILPVIILTLMFFYFKYNKQK